MPPAALRARPLRRPSPTAPSSWPLPPSHLSPPSLPSSPLSQSRLKCLLEIRAVARVPLSSFVLLENKARSPPHTPTTPPRATTYFIFTIYLFSNSNDFLLEKWDKQRLKKRAERRGAKTAGSKRLTGGCQHPLPVVCRRSSGALGQSAPSGPFTSGCAGFGREDALFCADPLPQPHILKEV